MNPEQQHFPGILLCHTPAQMRIQNPGCGMNQGVPVETEFILHRIMCQQLKRKKPGDKQSVQTAHQGGIQIEQNHLPDFCHHFSDNSKPELAGSGFTGIAHPVTDQQKYVHSGNTQGIAFKSCANCGIKNKGSVKQNPSCRTHHHDKTDPLPCFQKSSLIVHGYAEQGAQRDKQNFQC